MGKAHVDDTEIEIGMLGAMLSTLQEGYPEKRGVILRADRKVEYGVVARVMGAIREAGIDEIGMITEPVPTPMNTGDGSILPRALTSATR